MRSQMQLKVGHVSENLQ